MASQFQVVISGMAGGSADDWMRAKSAPDSELPALTDGQKDVARKMGIPEAEYARGVLVGKYSEERQKMRGQQLGEDINRILAGLGPSYHVEALVREGVSSRWVARVLTPSAVRNIAIPFEIADDVIESGAVQDIERLKEAVLKGLDREDLTNSNVLT